MSDARARLNIYSIAAHRGFADALVVGLIPRYLEDRFGLARLTLLLPSRRAIRTVTEAFVRLSGEGLVLPRMAVIGDIDLDETLGPLLDPIGGGADIPPAADPVRRWLTLAGMLRAAMAAEGIAVPNTAALLRQSREMARTMDRMLVEGIVPGDLLSERVKDIVGAGLAKHWERNLRLFFLVQQQWLDELARRGEVDAPARRNALFDHAARRWRENPPPHPVVVAGITSASPAIARLLRVVAGLPAGAVVLPDLDLAMDDAVWDALGHAGHAPEPDEPPLGSADAVTHPQYHLKLLLNRMGVNRGEVRPWHRKGIGAAPPARSRAISNLFLPPAQSASWVELPASRRRLSGVRVMETAHPEAEAQAISVLIRQALEEPGKRIALVTPDRGLAGRVIAHLARWNVIADDSAGQPLPQTVAGRMFLHLAEVIATQVAPVPFLSVMVHPLAGGTGEARQHWLENARKLDLALRGPRIDAGLAPLAKVAMERARQRGDEELARWWQAVETHLAPLAAMGEGGQIDLAEALDTLAAAGEGLCGTALWAQADGRMLAACVEGLREAARAEPVALDPAELPAILRDAMDLQSVRPPWGGHPRIAIYGLIEARMSRADLVICGGLTEGSWPAPPTTDPLIAPAVLRALGVPGADFRIGLAAHDLAAALGAPEVVLSYARRDVAGPVIASRFVLRVRAMLGEQFAAHEEVEAPKLAEALDEAEPAEPCPQPRPMPSASQRKVDISATALDRLRSDPYQFYASHILRLKRLDPIDEEPTPAWKGTAVHGILQTWSEKFGCSPGTLLPLAAGMLSDLSGHPFMRGLWQPRLLEGLKWLEAEQTALIAEGRQVLLVEKSGEMVFDGVKITAKADRIDRLPDGNLAIIDYKTGMPPSASMVEQGFALQLGTTGLIAERGGFANDENGDVRGTPTHFEYWSLARSRDGFGYRAEPVLEGRKRSGIPREEFLARSAHFLTEAIDWWILGNAPFTARLNPDLAGYNDYDQLMRLEEWQGRSDALADSGA